MHRYLCPAAMLAACALTAVAHAQPKMIITPFGDDMSGDGTKCVGWIAAPTYTTYYPYVWERGLGATQVSSDEYGGSSLSCSADVSAMSTVFDNTADWGDLNCFAGYCFGSQTGCTIGEPHPPQNPCSVAGLAHRWTLGTGWVNAGSFDRMLDPGTGRWFGGTRCDYNINYTGQMSGDGRYVVGGAWYANLTTDSGGPGFGLCGDFFGFRYDSQTGVFEKLPTSSSTTHAQYVNHDGSVVTGYDEGLVPDGLGGFQDARRPVVWVDNVQTVLDGLSLDSPIFPVNGAGTVIAGAPGAAFNQANFGTSGIRLVKWTRQANGTWTPTNLGRPTDIITTETIFPLVDLFVGGISDDGNTIIGTAVYGQEGPGGLQRAFIWRPTINGGVPKDLQDYIAQINPGNPMTQQGLYINWPRAMSPDGNTMLVGMFDWRDTCPDPLIDSHFGFQTGIIYLNGASVACDPPRIARGPSDWSESHDYSFGVALNVFASGSWPLTYQWQREDQNSPGTWNTLADNCSGFDNSNWDYEGTATRQIRIGQHFGGGGRGGRYRVVISNSCGSVTSDPATVTFLSGACCVPGFGCSIDYVTTCTDPLNGGTYLGDGTTCEFDTCSTCAEIDFNNDGLFPDTTDLFDYLEVFSGGACSTFPVFGCDGIDFNQDGVFPDIADLELFLLVFAGGSC